MAKVELRRDEESLDVNRLAARRLVADLAEAGLPVSVAERVPGGHLIANAPVHIVDRFLARFQNHPGSMLSDPQPIRRYIEERSMSELAEWDILLAATQRTEPESIVDTSLGIEINCQRRGAGNKSDERTLRITNKQRVASRGVEQTGVDSGRIEEAQAKYREEIGVNASDSRVNYPDRIYRAVRQRPLLILHLLKIDAEPGGVAHRDAVVAWSISFPRTQLEEHRVEYIVNTTWLRENYREDVDEDEIGGDIE